MPEKSTRKPGEKIETWGLLEGEKVTDCSSHDEFIVLPEGYETGMVVQRNGIVTNRWADGTCGLTAVQHNDAAACERMVHKDGREVAAFENVVVDKDGNGLRVATVNDLLPIIDAEVHDDKNEVIIHFDALDWFEEASRDDIIALAECGWGGDYAADCVASGTNEIAEVIEDWDGFECHVNEAQALDWLKDHRPETFRKVVNA